MIIRAPLGHTGTQAPHPWQAEKSTWIFSPGTRVFLPWGQTGTHLPHPVHLTGLTANWGAGENPKGLLHQRDIAEGTP